MRLRLKWERRSAEIWAAGDGSFFITVHQNLFTGDWKYHILLHVKPKKQRGSTMQYLTDSLVSYSSHENAQRAAERLVTEIRQAVRKEMENADD